MLLQYAMNAPPFGGVQRITYTHDDDDAFDVSYGHCGMFTRAPHRRRESLRGQIYNAFRRTTPDAHMLIKPIVFFIFNSRFPGDYICLSNIILSSASLHTRAHTFALI